MPEARYEKLANTVLYLLDGSKPTRPGVVQVLKMLWFADYWHYKKHLRSITGGQYVARVRGPVLEGYHDLFERMEKDRILERREVKVWGHPDQPKQEYWSLMEPDVATFTESELEVLQKVVDLCGDKTGNKLSEWTHLQGPWQSVWSEKEPNQPIPYSVFRWLDNLPNDADIEKATKALNRPHVVKEREALSAVADR